MRQKNLVLLHVLVWLVLVFNDVIPHFLGNEYAAFRALPKDAGLLLRYTLIGIGFYTVAALCFYGSSLVVAPLLFLHKRFIKAICMAVVMLGVLAGWRYIVEFGFFKPVLGFDNYRGNQVSAQYYIGNVFWYYYPKYFIYGLMYFFGENWLRSRNREQALQKEKLVTELAFLRSQVNPHFLFNTINDIYALAYQKSEQAPEALLKLSELLRYMLREGADDFMPLQSEIDYLHNLIELQRIGAKGNAYINFEIEGYVGAQKVASLLFVAFVENAFKHGVLNNAATPVNIRILATNDRIDFTVSNKISNSQKDKAGGIGLNNVKRRLELLYPGRHKLAVTANDHYIAHLQLQLNT
ncbi:histidine kinase [Mucilaginibacter oryzae]|uniref:Histidine kinase n=1 Tax=Mucilaginibacter oryzae TaxID=468058 RepID=A0A316HA06_9SPHI|nr:sensor histidine kinase [Mucilaginibacter oryzae]PWK78039.1 histidine kinase [Mucilaginibacter oryzae]